MSSKNVLENCSIFVLALASLKVKVLRRSPRVRQAGKLFSDSTIRISVVWCGQQEFRSVTVKSNTFPSKNLIYLILRTQLARYFEWKMPKMEGQRVLELGSGTGIVGLVISCLGADVTLTDLDIVLPTLQGNVEKNTELIRSRGGRVPSVKRLEWGNEEDIAGLDGEGYNWIVGSDLIHCDEVVQPLLTTLLRLTESRPATPVLISYDLRGRQGKKMFLSRVAETFEVENVEQSSLPAAFRYSKLAIIVLRRKSVK